MPTETMNRTEKMPPVPLTLEGASLLHQMLRVRWGAWRALEAGERTGMLDQASDALAALEHNGSAAFSLLGHKGDILLIHFRQNFEELGAVETALAHLRLWDHLELTTSYLSVVELGLYESTAKVYAEMAGKGIAPHTPEWDA